MELDDDHVAERARLDDFFNNPDITPAQNVEVCMPDIVSADVELLPTTNLSDFSFIEPHVAEFSSFRPYLS
ncbi:hypothetical protein vseg_019742 [Gypsophila vaccaria]